MLKKYSVTDFLRFTHRIKKVKINGRWHLAEITKPVMEGGNFLLFSVVPLIFKEQNISIERGLELSMQSPINLRSSTDFFEADKL